MAFNPKFVQGATRNQIHKAMDYKSFLITPEQEQELKGKKVPEVNVDTDWKQEAVVKVDEDTQLSNTVIYPADAKQAVGVPYQHPSPRRVTGTAIYHNN
jgi:hypothetical protein